LNDAGNFIQEYDITHYVSRDRGGNTTIPHEEAFAEIFTNHVLNEPGLEQYFPTLSNNIESIIMELDNLHIIDMGHRVDFDSHTWLHRYDLRNLGELGPPIK
jgi:hypothetical protein